jgi:hypothetical protein
MASEQNRRSCDCVWRKKNAPNFVQDDIKKEAANPIPSASSGQALRAKRVAKDGAPGEFGSLLPTSFEIWGTRFQTRLYCSELT